MKTIAFYNICEELNKNNYMFENANVSVSDDLLLPLVKLREEAKRQKINIATVDVLDLKTADAFVFIDLPLLDNKYFRLALDSGKPLYLMVCESPLGRSEEFLAQNYHFFNKVFTWNDKIIDNRKFFKLNYAFDLPRRVAFEPLKKEKLCTLIATNHWSNHPLALYSERLKAIRWFTKYHPEEFDFYGHGWHKYRFKSRLLRVFNRPKLDFVRRLIPYKFSTYRGSVERKKAVLGKYRFVICYENYYGAAGYITEKIFDCFFAGCVPIYLGASNITDHIPADCFIDRRRFNNYQDLYGYLKTMPDQTYLSYLDRIVSFLRSEIAKQFSIPYFTETLVGELNKGLLQKNVTD